MTSINADFAPAATFSQGACSRAARTALAGLALFLVSGCAASGLTTAVGPSRGAILKSANAPQIDGMRIIPLTNTVAEQLSTAAPVAGFAEVIGDAQPIGTIVGVGDSLEITIWEAPPAVLFGAAALDTRIQAPIQVSRPGTFPETVVGPSGTITIPFAGQVPAAGRSLRQIEQGIVTRLRGKANQPQVIVRIARNATANVSVVGEVATAGRFPLTPRGERLLDLIAQAGGTRQPVDRMTVQVTRGSMTLTMPLQQVVRDARHNIVLQRDDIVTALFQPNSFVVLGAAGKNEEVRFEGVGLSLSQALGRLGGLQDMRADPKGVFLFRWETAERVRGFVNPQLPLPANGRVPVIFQVNLKQPETIFAAQNFAMKNGDVIFISNSPASDFQRFVSLLTSTVLPALTVTSTVRAQ
ncbi:MAG TPA: polysaccharide biosynthesis/export family protein [Sphingomicrobium sp.]|nr:polysaccharide biosynthesis/export family protein [Sphingomicrobium sp.]